MKKIIKSIIFTIILILTSIIIIKITSKPKNKIISKTEEINQTNKLTKLSLSGNTNNTNTSKSRIQIINQIRVSNNTINKTNIKNEVIKNNNTTNNAISKGNTTKTQTSKGNYTNSNKNEITAKTTQGLEWNLTLVNYENKMPDDYQIKLENIDQYRKFDSRAIKYLNSMLNDMKVDGATNIWPQSTYRSIETQKQLYNDKIQYYKSIGKSEKEAKTLTEQVINKPGYSDHNLGLAVDFNYVKESFKDTKEYTWLKQNAEEYGFILRYPKEKESITKVSYEPWHWRFVGIEHAKTMNELNMCLEEYVLYLNE